MCHTGNTVEFILSRVSLIMRFSSAAEFRHPEMVPTPDSPLPTNTKRLYHRGTPYLQKKGCKIERKTEEIDKKKKPWMHVSEKFLPPWKSGRKKWGKVESGNCLRLRRKDGEREEKRPRYKVSRAWESFWRRKKGRRSRRRGGCGGGEVEIGVGGVGRGGRLTVAEGNKDEVVMP